MTRISIKNLYRLICILLIIIPCQLSATIMTTIHDINISQSDLIFSKVQLDNNYYDLIEINEGSVVSKEGEPVLPVKHVCLAIPQGYVVKDVTAESHGSRQILSDLYLMPGQPPRPLKKMELSNMVCPPDRDVYNSAVALPGHIVTFEGQSNLAGQPLAHCAVYPVQYIPVEKKAIIHTHIELTVYCERETVSESTRHQWYFTFTEHQRVLYENMIKEMVENPEDVHGLNPLRGGPSRVLPPGEYDHVIITSNAFASYWDELIYWHTKKGIRDTVVTTQWIFANYSGPTDTLKIRQFIIDANTNWGTMYFLIAGEDHIVPFAQRYYVGEYPDQIAPSDQYYADYNDDWIDDVFVGRSTIENETQIHTFINKVLQYEKDPLLIDYPLEALMVGMALDESSPSWRYMDSIAAYLPGNFSIHKVYDQYGGNHKDSVLHHLNTGMNLMCHVDHCNQTVMGTGSFNHGWHINNNDVDNLVNNDRTTIITSVGCDPNRMDYNDCIAEHFVIYNEYQAGVAFVGNTRHGWYYVGNAGGLSGELQKAWWRGVFVEKQEDLGTALWYSKSQFIPGGDDHKQHCQWTFNTLGEPAMPIWTDTPDTLLVNHDPMVPPSPNDFTVSVKDNDGITPIEGALVCCWIPHQTPEMYATAYTNASGQVSLSISATTPGDTMFVTVTKHNYLPHEGSALVTVESGPYVRVGTLVLNDENGNGVANPGEEINLGVWAQNIGVDPAHAVYGLLSESNADATITIDSSWYGDIPPFADSSLSIPYYHLTIGNCHDGYTVELSLDFHDENDTIWTSHPEIEIYAPALTLENYVVMSGNGIVDPGETADVIITMKNEGRLQAEYVTAALTTPSQYITINNGSSGFGTIDTGMVVDNASDPYNLTADSATPYATPIDFSLIIEAVAYFDTINFTLMIGNMVPSDTGCYYAYYSGGPHPYSPIFEWIAIDSTQAVNPGYSLDLGRNETVVIDLPFTFTYYGIDYSQISICSNGWIAMDSVSSTDYVNNHIPHGTGPPAMIAGIWDDLDPGAPDDPGDVYYYYDSLQHRFVVEYFCVKHAPSGGIETFEIILCDPAHYQTPTGDGEIIVQYLTPLTEDDVTIGIENQTEAIGIEYFYNGDYHTLAVPLTDSFALRYTTHEVPSGIEEYDDFVNMLPMSTMLSMLYPNPSYARVTIMFQLSKMSAVHCSVYDIAGRSVRSIAHGMYDSGFYSVTWDGNDDRGRALPAGIYFVHFKSDDYQKVEKIVILR